MNNEVRVVVCGADPVIYDAIIYRPGQSFRLPRHLVSALGSSVRIVPDPDRAISDQGLNRAILDSGLNRAG